MANDQAVGADDGDAELERRFDGREVTEEQEATSTDANVRNVRTFLRLRLLQTR